MSFFPKIRKKERKKPHENSFMSQKVQSSHYRHFVLKSLSSALPANTGTSQNF